MSDGSSVHFQPAPTRVHAFGLGVIPDDLEVVVFHWSNEKGHCYECGAPAAFALANEGPVRDETLRCAVCAAMAAVDGETIVWLYAEDFA